MRLMIFLVFDLQALFERESIWRIQIAKYRRNPSDFDLVQLARAADGLAKNVAEMTNDELL